MNMERNNGDRAELEFVTEVPDGEYNREVEIKATPRGIEIDGFILIQWDWILKASSQLVRSCPDTTLTCAPAERDNSAT